MPSDIVTLDAHDLDLIDQAWENHKAGLPVAVVIDDNQPGRTAIIEITVEPPTLVVGTKLFAAPKMVHMSEKRVHISDAWQVVSQWLADYAEEEETFSRYRDDVVIDGVMTAGQRRKLSAALADTGGAS
jgi:hypothetical protein